MKLRRREWLILCGLVVTAATLGRGAAFGGEGGMRALIPGAEEYLKATAEARKAQFQRYMDQRRFLNEPQVRAAWVRFAHDRFTASPSNCDLDIQFIGAGHVRGMRPQSVEDNATGDLLRITYGDYGDHYMKGTLRVGRQGTPLPLYIRTLEEDGQSLFVVNSWRIDDNNISAGWVQPFPDEKAMNVLARFFNCPDSGFHFVAMHNRPHTLDRPKERYGPDKIDLYVRDRNAFLDHYVDEHYAGLGLDPGLGKLDPNSIPRPNR
jgi:hypothetical protein